MATSSTSLFNCQFPHCNKQRIVRLNTQPFSFCVCLEHLICPFHPKSVIGFVLGSSACACTDCFPSIIILGPVRSVWQIGPVGPVDPVDPDSQCPVVSGRIAYRSFFPQD